MTVDKELLNINRSSWNNVSISQIRWHIKHTTYWIWLVQGHSGKTRVGGIVFMPPCKSIYNMLHIHSEVAVECSMEVSHFWEGSKSGECVKDVDRLTK